MLKDTSKNKTISSSSAGKDKGLDEETVRLGRELITNLYVLMKTVQIHDVGNVALDNPTEKSMKTLKGLWQWNKRVHIHLKGDYLFLDEFRLKMDAERVTSFTGFIEELKRVQLGGITFDSPLSKHELTRFVSLVMHPDPNNPEPFQELETQVRQTGIKNIDLERWEVDEEKFEAIHKDKKEQAKSSYFKTITTVTEVMGNIKIGKAVSIKRSKRSVQTMVDLLLAEESTLIGLTTLRCHDVYTHNHSVNVCILSLAMGQRLGYTKKQSTILGMAGLFHDMGKASIPLEILNKSTEFNEEDWRLMRRHPIDGVKYLLRFKGINDMTIRMVTGVFEHHLNFDLSGYPKIRGPWKVSLTGRIISIVDCYDALTSSRVYNRTPYPPDKALKFMLSKGGKAFDPGLLKIFVNCIGIFPIGTLLLLNTKEMAIVMETHPDLEMNDRPRVKIISDANGNQVDGKIVDLSDGQQAEKRCISKTLDPTKYKIDVSWYFIS